MSSRCIPKFIMLVCLLCSAFSAARLSKSGRDKLQFRVHSELERQQEPAAAQELYDGLPGETEYEVDLTDQDKFKHSDQEEEEEETIGLLDWLTSFRMGEDLADKVDEFICAWDKVVGTDLDTLVVLILGWLGFGGVIFTVSHLVYSTLGPGTADLAAPPPAIPPYRGPDTAVQGAGRGPAQGQGPGEVVAQIPAQPPPTSEWGVVGADPGAVHYTSLCLQHLSASPALQQQLTQLWLHNLNQFTIKSALEDGMLVEFAELEESEALVPALANMTVETMPNDNLLLGGELTLSTTFQLRVSRPVQDQMMISEYSLHLDRVRGRFSVTFINAEDLAVAKLEGWPDIKARLVPVVGGVASLSREELNLLEVVEDVALAAVRRVQCDLKPSTIQNFPVFVKTNTEEKSNARKKMNPAFGQNSAVVAGTNSLGGGLGEGATRQLEVAVVRAAGLGGARALCLEPYVVLEVDEPSQKHQTRVGAGAQYGWNDTFTIEITKASAEILFEVWDQGQKIGKSDAFMGLAIVSVTELLATASQRHVVPLQGRPYEEDQVTGMLTVEFLFTSSSPAPAPAPAAEVARFSGVSHSEARTVVNKPLGIMKQPQPDPGAEAAARKTFSPYFEYNGQQLQPDLLKPPSRSSSMKRTAFAEPLERVERVEPSPAQLREIADCRVPATSTAINTAEDADVANLARPGRARTRTFFTSLKRKLSATRSHSSVRSPQQALDELNGVRSASEHRQQDSLGRPQSMSWMSDTSSVSGLSAISNTSTKTFVSEDSSLVLEVLEPDRHHYYLVPLQTARRGRFKKRGTKLHIYMDHTFVAQHIKVGTKCAVCGRGVGLRPGKQGYICRDCGLVTHKQCHVRAEVHCPNTTVPSLDLEYYSEEKKK